jgi:hypothetical protein
MKMPVELVTRKDNRSEFRQYRKFPLSLPLQYRFYAFGQSGVRKVDTSGSGRTLSICSGEVIFEGDQPLAEGADADLYIEWPVSLSKSVGLTLRIVGRIAWANRNRFAMVLKSWEFRTRAVPVASGRGAAAEENLKAG